MSVQVKNMFAIKVEDKELIEPFLDSLTENTQLTWAIGEKPNDTKPYELENMQRYVDDYGSIYFDIILHMSSNHPLTVAMWYGSHLNSKKYGTPVITYDGTDSYLNYEEVERWLGI